MSTYYIRAYSIYKIYLTTLNQIAFYDIQVETALSESPSKLRDLTDPCIRGTFAYDSLKTTVQIAINCLDKEPSRRPSVEDVLWHMQYSIQVQEGATNSGNLSGNQSGKLSGKISGNLNNKFY